jgi:hypothetical protein
MPTGGVSNIYKRHRRVLPPILYRSAAVCFRSPQRSAPHRFGAAVSKSPKRNVREIWAPSREPYAELTIPSRAPAGRDGT